VISVKRLQISLEPEQDQWLAGRARETGTSKAGVVRALIEGSARRDALPPLEEDPLWEIVGMSDQDPGGESVDDVVYPG